MSFSRKPQRMAPTNNVNERFNAFYGSWNSFLDSTATDSIRILIPTTNRYTKHSLSFRDDAIERRKRWIYPISPTSRSDALITYWATEKPWKLQALSYSNNARMLQITYFKSVLDFTINGAFSHDWYVNTTFSDPGLAPTYNHPLFPSSLSKPWFLCFL